MKSRHEPVLILHHAIPAPGSCHNAESDAGVMDEVKIVSETFQMLKIPCRVAAVESLTRLPEILRSAPERLILNLVENFPDRPADAMQVPTVCEAFGRECTGNESSNQTLALDKWRTKAVLQAAGLPVPGGVVIPCGANTGSASLALQKEGSVLSRLPAGPWIVKPLYADASEGIHPTSVAHDGKALNAAIRRIHRDFKHPALVEAFFGTRELNVALFQRGDRIEILPVAEIEFRGFGEDRPRIIDYAAKWHTDSFEYKNTVRVVPAKLDRPLAARIRAAALAAWQTLGCRDYARVDFRLDEAGNFVILEVNPNPDISPDSGFEAALKAAKIPYSDFVEAIYTNAASRLALKKEVPPTRATSPARTRKQEEGQTLIRLTESADRDGILEFMRETGFFHDSEIEVAREVLDEAITKGPSGHYQSFTLLDEGEPAGWICYGPTPCTTGTFDVYWIGVSSSCQGLGYGRALLAHVENLIRQQEGRQVIIETSGRALYEATRGFYLKTGYHEAARVSEFYAPGDDRVIYSKRIRK